MHDSAFYAFSVYGRSETNAKNMDFSSFFQILHHFLFTFLPDLGVYVSISVAQNVENATMHDSAFYAFSVYRRSETNAKNIDFSSFFPILHHF